MHFVVFGHCISSSWGNGHATLWRGLVKALVCRGHTLSFYEKDVPYYASTRDGWIPPAGVRVCLYAAFEDVMESIERETGGYGCGALDQLLRRWHCRLPDFAGIGCADQSLL